MRLHKSEEPHLLFPSGNVRLSHSHTNRRPSEQSMVTKLRGYTSFPHIYGTLKKSALEELLSDIQFNVHHTYKHHVCLGRLVYSYVFFNHHFCNAHNYVRLSHSYPNNDEIKKIPSMPHGNEKMSALEGSVSEIQL